MSTIEALRHLEKLSVNYFRDQEIHGFTYDRAFNFPFLEKGEFPISIATSGFGLAVKTYAPPELIHEQEAEVSIEKALLFAKKIERYAGCFPHFFNKNGERVWDCEYSTIDTAIFLAGALHAAEKFKHNRAIRDTAYDLYHDFDPEKRRTHNNDPCFRNEMTVSMGWRKGYLNYHWNSAELELLLLLGIGHPDPHKRLPVDVWNKFQRHIIRDKGQLIVGSNFPVFVHLLASCFADLRGYEDPHFGNLYENAKNAILYIRNQALNNQGYLTYRKKLWGDSESDAPNGGYAAHSQDPSARTGVVSLMIAAAAAKVSPEVIGEDVARWIKQSIDTSAMSPFERQQAFIRWHETPPTDEMEKFLPLGIYGWPDGMTLSGNDGKRWASPYSVGLRQGTFLLSHWGIRTQIEPIQTALDLLVKNACLKHTP